VAISQSGETADTLAALQEANQKGASSLALVNVIDSVIARLADGAFYTYAGPEIGVASTKCFTAQLAALLLLAIYFGERTRRLKQEEAKRILKELIEIPRYMREVLRQETFFLEIARKYANKKNFLYLGRGLNFAIALEGALKLKEISYIHAEGYAAGEMKHGPIALIDENMPVVALIPQDDTYEKLLSNLQEVRARDGTIIAIATKGDTKINKLAQEIIYLPLVDKILTPFVFILPLQLIAYYIADFLGTDVDQPRNLAKTVTVE
jgi:glucosamine--fructose-6-phosphate aminotransferase (isomerizing)